MEATLAGDFQAAVDAYVRARECLGDDASPGQRDGADLNLAMIYIQMGEAKLGEEGLREILLRTSDTKLAFTAAYNLASSLRKQGRYDRAMSYAQRALDRAATLEADDLMAAGRNLLGNIYLYQSYLKEAYDEYTVALALREAQDGDTRYSRAILLENIGYCLLLRKKPAEGVEKIQTALSLAQQVGDRRCRAECLQDLCYGYLLQGDYELSMSYGGSALDEAVSAGYKDIEENCYYLLGEIGSRTDDPDLRDEHFQRLQDLHPELPFLREFLCAVDITTIITLKR